jgi:polar amino acid transport system substrate-binding protein
MTSQGTRAAYDSQSRWDNYAEERLMNAWRSAVALTAAIMVGACGGTAGPTTTSSGPGKVAAVAAEVPTSVTGPIQIATDATYQPNEFVNRDTGAIQGWEVDFGNAVCRVMGLVCTFNNVTFDDIITQLKAGTPAEVAGGDAPRYAFSISSWNPTAAREQSGIDFVSYYRAGEAWLSKVGGQTINAAADMCGHTVAVVSGSVEANDVWGFMGKQAGGSAISGDTDNCQAAGKAAINVLTFDTQAAANSAVLTGRADFGWFDQTIGAYQVKQLDGRLKLSGQACSVAPYGIAMLKGSSLEKAITDAVKYLIDNGYYTAILKNWNVQGGAITSADVALNNNSVGPTCVPAY